MSNNTNLSKLANVLDDGSDGQFLKSTGSGGVVFADVAAGAVVYANPDLLPLTGNSAGDMAYVTSTNRFYINNGSGWYSVGLVNTNPNITSVQDGSSGTTPFTLTTDGTATVITITASDPEEVPLTYGYSVTSGSLTNGGGTTATVTQGTGSNTNQFTVTPSTNTAYGGTFEITFTASDGINQAQSANEFTLNFVTNIENSKYTAMLVQAVGSNNGVNNSISNSSSSHSNNPTTAGTSTGVTAGTFSPYRSGGYSGKFVSSNSDRLTKSNAPTLGNGTFTVECFVYFDAFPSSNKHLFGQTDWGSGSGRWAFYTDSSNRVKFLIRTASTGVTFSTNSNVLETGKWYHLCATRDANNLVTFYVDGVSVGTPTTAAVDLNYNILSIGGHSNGQYNDCRIRDARGVSGSVITPPSGGPTEPLEAVTGTAFLALHKPYVCYDTASTTNNAFDTVSVTSFEPFGPYDSEEYDAADNGGSIFIDASGGCLEGTLPTGGLGTTFTVEMWIYDDGTGGNTSYGGYFTTTDLSSQYGMQLRRYGAYIFNSTSGTSLTWNSSGDPFATVFGIGWHHVAAVHNGSTFKVYVDGKEVISTSDSHTYSSVNYKVGQPWLYQSDSSQQAKAYIADLRIKTSAEYSGEFTPPTAPLSSTNAVVHLKGTDASIIDKSGSGNLTLVGDTKCSTTAVVYNSNTISSKSLYFDGSGDYITNLPDDMFAFGYDPFTVEFWINTSSYPSSYTNRYHIIGSSTSAGNKFVIKLDSQIQSGDSNGDTYSISSAGYANMPTAGNWVHVAFVRTGTGNHQYKVYINGSQGGSETDNTNWGTATDNTIGATASGNYGFSGYLQDLRVTKGYARYTGNFTPPTTELKG